MGIQSKVRLRQENVSWWALVLCLLTSIAGAQPGPSASDELFTNTAIRHLRIEIPEDGMNTLRQYRWRAPGNPEDRIPVRCRVLEGQTVYRDVAVHLKGAAGSFRPVDSKPGLTLKFDKFAKNQHFHGLEKITLNNSVQDPTYITEKLCREIYAQANVPVPRADYATVELNGRLLGLYVLTEGWDKTFLKRHFKNVDGTLYDPPQGWDINKPMPEKEGESPEGQEELLALAAAAKDPDLSNRLAELRKRVDLERLLSLAVLDAMAWNWDGYPMNKNNYRVFHDLGTGRFVIMPHGMDQMFWRPDGPIVTGRNGLVARGVMQTAEGRRLYLDRFAQLRPQVFKMEALTNRVEALAARIRPALAKMGPMAATQHERMVNSLRQRIFWRERSIDEQLEGLKNLLKIGVSQTVALSGWKPCPVRGQPVFDQPSDPEALRIKLAGPSAGAWQTTIWLEEGIYIVEGRIKTRNLVADGGQALGGAGVRVWSTRKITEGPHWGWFPYRESRDLAHRGEVASTNCVKTRLSGTTEWTRVVYEVELRHPVADLLVLCEAYAESGEAWFDPKSFRITRRTDICP